MLESKFFSISATSPQARGAEAAYLGAAVAYLVSAATYLGAAAAYMVYNENKD